VIGVSIPPGQFSQGFIWDRANGMRPLSMGPDYLRPVAINNRGQIAIYVEEPLSRAALWMRSEGLRDIGTLGGSSAQPTDINEWGVIVGASQTSELVNHPFIWTASSGMLNLNERLDRSSVAAQNIELRIAKAINEVGWIAADGIDVREVALGRDNGHAYLLIPQTAAGTPRCR
jgi:probable HAF family extracellular repeat protein